VVIVGASIGGVNVATDLRSQGYTGSIVIVDQDPRLPYDKPPLSKHALKPDWDGDSALLKPATFYDEHAIELRLGVRATGFRLDPRGGGTILLEGGAGSQVSGDVIVLAPGVRARTLPVQDGEAHSPLAGVHVIRTAEDSARLREALGPGRRVVVVGGGFIGAEAAGIAQERGCDVTIVELDTVPFARLFGEDVGRALTRRHRDRGIRVLTGCGVDRLEAADPDRERLGAVTLTDGRRLEADIVILGLGAVPATEWLEGSGIDLLRDGGIRTDEHGFTGRPGVYAVGDAAAWWSPREQAHLRVEHWTTTKEQASVVAHTIAHPDEPRRTVGKVAYFWSDQHGARLQFLGESVGADETCVVHGSLEEEEFVVLFGRGGRLIGALGLSAARYLMPYRPHIEAGDPIDALVASKVAS